MSIAERRFKIVAVDPMLILSMFRINSVKPERIVVPALPDMPEGYEVEDICFDPSRVCFLLRISHPDFPAVEMGTTPDVLLMTIDLAQGQYVNANALSGEIAEAYRRATDKAEFKPRLVGGEVE